MSDMRTYRLWQGNNRRYYYAVTQDDYCHIGSAYISDNVAVSTMASPKEIVRLLATGNGESPWYREGYGPKYRQMGINFTKKHDKEDKVIL